MRATVYQVWSNGGTLAEGRAKLEDGRDVRFAGDWRPMRDIYEAIERGEDVEVEIEDYQILAELPRIARTRPKRFEVVWNGKRYTTLHAATKAWGKQHGYYSLGGGWIRTRAGGKIQGWNSLGERLIKRGEIRDLERAGGAA